MSPTETPSGASARTKRRSGPQPGLFLGRDAAREGRRRGARAENGFVPDAETVTQLARAPKEADAGDLLIEAEFWRQAKACLHPRR